MLDVQGLRFRAAFFHSLRSFFIAQQFLEVDTPIRQPLLLPEANIQPLTSEDSYLQASPELCMKRLLALGCDRIFQLCNCFRKGERGRLHLEEFTMLEWYRAGAGYEDLMDDCEQLVSFLLVELGGMEGCVVGGNGSRDSLRPGGSDRIIATQPHWERLSVQAAFARFSPVSLEQALASDTFDEVLVEYVEPHLGLERPLFLYDYPVALGSLARRKDRSPHLVERFELYINGIELANGFSELTDVDEQRQRFTEELRLMEKGGRQPMPMPERFLEDLAHLDQAAGIALGVDRLLMLLMGKRCVGEVVSFAPDDLA
ncbi:MAG: lysyl-tRNA synthetase class [Desulfobulbaceae bacterium]|nr:MAG: lysyl-tRNA synthetase class [Desulfobulbaceae bacterium]